MSADLYKTHRVPNKPRVSKHRFIVSGKEPMILQQQINELTAQIKTLTIQKKAYQQQLKAMKQPKISKKYMALDISLYALELDDGCWYIGSSRNVEKRFKVHCRGDGAKWTKTHKPIRIHEIRKTGISDDAEVASLEDQMTLEYAILYGPQQVRGGGYCQAKPHWPKHISEPSLAWIV